MKASGELLHLRFDCARLVVFYKTKRGTFGSKKKVSLPLLPARNPFYYIFNVVYSQYLNTLANNSWYTLKSLRLPIVAVTQNKFVRPIILPFLYSTPPLQ